MGGSSFFVRGKGESAEVVFQRLRQQAGWESGHGGYSGTIYEKDSFVVVQPPAGVDPAKFADDVGNYNVEPTNAHLAKAKQVYDDKWGPAVCIPLSNKEWIFCGIASS